MTITKIDTLDYKQSVIYLIDKKHSLRGLGLSEGEIHYAKERFNLDKYQLFFNKFDKKIFICAIDTDKELFKRMDKARKASQKITGMINDQKIESIQVTNIDVDDQTFLAFIEAIGLSNYQFLKYFTKDIDKKKNTLSELKVYNPQITQQQLDNLNWVIQATNLAKDLVNEPYPALNSENLPERISSLAYEAGFKYEVLEHTQIQSLKMGGLLAVNRGSQYKPTFNILTWKPENHKNQKPIILVGKGVMFDSGGLNLKPTGYIETMKSDMAGAAAVVGIIYAAAKINLPYYLIGLIPATDNAISNQSYAPGEVITIHNGTTVEIKNTDAEGRLILADALSYAKKYDPYLVIDFATLTGSAMRALGPYASALFSKADQQLTDKLIESGFRTYERLVQFPLWEEYDEMLKSEIADIKNIGGSNAGLITAAKFLERFTDYSWIHLDIAPTAYLEDNKDFRGKGATGYGVRLIIDFLQNINL